VTQSALTSLTDDEELFRSSVYEFADRDVRPLVRTMDDEAKMPRDLIERLFALGVMGIEIPDEFGGSGATFFHSVLAVEALSRVDPSVGVLVDVHNTLVINALLRWGSEQQKRTLLPRLAEKTVGAYALSEAGSGSDAFALTTRATARGTEHVESSRPEVIGLGTQRDARSATDQFSGRAGPHRRDAGRIGGDPDTGQRVEIRAEDDVPL
jgi:alkylation response protein AidB-like acyl-CoA dehydrogenase